MGCVCSFINQPVAWRPLSSTKVMLTKTDPISANNLVALNVTTYNNPGGIVNSGYWGVPLNGGWVYHFSMYIKGDTDAKASATLVAGMSSLWQEAEQLDWMHRRRTPGLRLAWAGASAAHGLGNGQRLRGGRV